MESQTALAADGADEAGQRVVAHERVDTGAEERRHAGHVEGRGVSLRPAAYEEVDRYRYHYRERCKRNNGVIAGG